MKRDQRKIFEQLRRDHPVFSYESFSYEVVRSELRIYFDFRIGDKISFKPTHVFNIPTNFQEDRVSDSLFRNIIFNLGMIELLSYWKSACPPKIVIKAARITDDQIAFWKKIYRHGLGEFFYLNGLSLEDDHMEIVSAGDEIFSSSELRLPSHDSILVPIGGGKDSVITLEMMKHHRKCSPYIMNPREASIATTVKAGYAQDEIVVSGRQISPELLELNDKGYLNGHTPFSALLAFTSLLVAYLNDIQAVALSNESSANEASIPGTMINHQYSKSFEFENDFRDYVNKNITGDINYFSYLRPLNELQIAKLFSTYPQHFFSFRSCNVGSKTNSWCGKCPKCLFTYIILLPFIDQEELNEIFGKNLLENIELLHVMKQLCGLTDEKPFECVGTIDEVNATIRYCITNVMKGEYPVLIQEYLHLSGDISDSDANFERLLNEFGPHNIQGVNDINLLKAALNVD